VQATGWEIFSPLTRTLETDLSKLKEMPKVLFEVELAGRGSPKAPSPELEDMEGESGLAPLS
jgi:hypothetical protein